MTTAISREVYTFQHFSQSLRQGKFVPIGFPSLLKQPQVIMDLHIFFDRSGCSLCSNKMRKRIRIRVAHWIISQTTNLQNCKWYCIPIQEIRSF